MHDVATTDSYNDDRTHNDVNELTARDTDDNGTDDFTLVHDAVGNLTDDGENYTYVWDPFGRLRKVQTRDVTPKLVAEYRYNGLGHRIGWHYDANVDDKVDGSDPWYYFFYDERWRIVATYRDDDNDPKEQFVHHNAGPSGYGASSYIDTVILRDKDADTAWTSASDGTLEERIYHCQNWRADVVALVDDTGDLVEQDRYSSYGIPFGMLAGDVDGSGSIDATDISQIQSWITTSSYVVRGDLDLDGSLDAADKTIATNNQGSDLGWGSLSNVGSRRGLAGYESDATLVTVPYHVRARVLDTSLGRWLSRDSLQYSDGANLMAYAQSNPVKRVDPSGMIGLLHGCIGFNCALQPGGGGGFQAPPCGRDHPDIPDEGPWQLPPGVDPPFPIGPRDGNYNTRSCCLMACLQGVNTFGGQHTYGRTLCCAGKRVSCACRPQITQRFPNAVDIVRGCVQTHEDDHKRFLNCEDNRICVMEYCAECSAYDKELQCIADKCGWDPNDLPTVYTPCDACDGNEGCSHDIFDKYFPDTLEGRHTNCTICDFIRIIT